MPRRGVGNSYQPSNYARTAQRAVPTMSAQANQIGVRRRSEYA